MTSLFRCYGYTDVNQTYFFDKFIQSLVNVWGSLPHQAQTVLKVLAVQSWDGVPLKNPNEPP